jgi:hypothetical protein
MHCMTWDFHDSNYYDADADDDHHGSKFLLRKQLLEIYNFEKS